MENKPTSTETLLGGAQFTATKIDGTTEVVTIKQLAIRQLPELAARLEDENAQAELYCGKEKGWSDTLTNESLEALIVEAERINADFFARWAKRKMERVNRIVPGAVERQIERSAATSLK